MPETLLAEEILPPFFPSWPEEPQPLVNVLCEGPSIEDVRWTDLLPGPTVAVNHAVALSQTLPVDLWATIDHPEILWSWAARHLHEKARLFTTTNNLMFWQDILGDGIAERLYAWEPTFMVSVNGSPEVKGENGVPAVLPTLIHVLAWLSSLAGTKHVRVFGADMRGSWSNLSAVPFSASEEGGWDIRWAVERKLFALSTQKYRSRGQRLERWDPPSSDTRNRSFSS